MTWRQYMAALTAHQRAEHEAWANALTETKRTVVQCDDDDPPPSRASDFFRPAVNRLLDVTR